MEEPSYGYTYAMVSIRTRPFGRVMPAPKICSARSVPSFNPHPAFRPGDARRHSCRAGVRQVSIRTRPFGRVMQAARLRRQAGELVSIRTRPFGRVMRHQMAALRPCAVGFNPHPAFRPGDATEAQAEAGNYKMFQSAPGLSAG